MWHHIQLKKPIIFAFFNTFCLPEGEECGLRGALWQHQLSD